MKCQHGALLQHLLPPNENHRLASDISCLDTRSLETILFWYGLLTFSLLPFRLSPSSRTACTCSSWGWPRRSRICTEKLISPVRAWCQISVNASWKAPARPAVTDLMITHTLARTGPDPPPLCLPPQRRRSTTWRASWRSTASRCPPSARSAGSWPTSSLWTKPHVRGAQFRFTSSTVGVEISRNTEDKIKTCKTRDYG